MKAFGGGAGNQVKCAVCDSAVYPNDPQITLDGIAYHKSCAKCSDCSCQITLGNFCKFGTTLFCKTHYFKRFSEEGTYLGGEKYAQKSTGGYVAKEASFVPKGTSSSVNDAPAVGAEAAPEVQEISTEEAVTPHQAESEPVLVEEAPAATGTPAVEASESNENLPDSGAETLEAEAVATIEAVSTTDPTEAEATQEAAPGEDSPVEAETPLTDAPDGDAVEETEGL
jgi:hypothetical protein